MYTSTFLSVHNVDFKGIKVSKDKKRKHDDGSIYYIRTIKIPVIDPVTGNLRGVEIDLFSADEEKK